MASTAKRQASCEERIDGQLRDELDTLRKLWALQCEGKEEGDPDLGTFNEHGLAFDYVAAGTFGEKQDTGYFRYQISWGGPSDEFRFYTDARLNVGCVEYVFQDWFDGANRELAGKDKALLLEIFEDFRDCGTVEAELAKATA